MQTPRGISDIPSIVIIIGSFSSSTNIEQHSLKNDACADGGIDSGIGSKFGSLQNGIDTAGTGISRFMHAGPQLHLHSQLSSWLLT